MAADSWYVLQVSDGREQRALDDLKRMGYPAFAPQRVMLERKSAKWRKVKRLLLPGYVFLNLDLCAQAYYAIRRMSSVIRFLGAAMPETVPPEEMRHMFLHQFLQDEVFVWDVSEGHLEGDRLIIDTGPLVGREDAITSYDKRQQRATVTFTVLGKPHEADLAVMITSSPKAPAGDSSPAAEEGEQGAEQTPES
jgi:transcriptional antiterminator NusG